MVEWAINQNRSPKISMLKYNLYVHYAGKDCGMPFTSLETVVGLSGFSSITPHCPGKKESMSVACCFSLPQ
jgi:hypothetical protein